MDDFRIVFGAEYRYLGPSPAGCRGQRYRPVRLALAVPAYQEQVLVEGLTGPDAGHWFCCSPANFATRYEPVPAAPVPDKPAPRTPSSGA